MSNNYELHESFIHAVTLAESYINDEKSNDIPQASSVFFHYSRFAIYNQSCYFQILRRKMYWESSYFRVSFEKNRITALNEMCSDCSY